ncbi:universal stress protein [Actinokineospora fastidiosa]|uniref:Universal stress protein n=1 Tax=Actinokineospora fastidiosa TaxID=1816 RepID=A0A918GB90_9PSEU|nr:universal stress protein [Actinokineospora fastidiosa]GGS28363.1 universal stress protein [Actinokineospora fastidiosa]
MTAPIVVGVDGSDSALAAVAWAAAEARRRALPLRLVHACALPPLLAPADERRWVAELTAFGEQALRTASAAVEDVVVDHQVLIGSAVPALVGESARAHSLVIGHRGLGGFHRALVGSVAVALAAHAACPVVVVRGTSAEDGPVVVGVDGTPASEAAIAYAFGAAALRGARLVAVHTWSEVMLSGRWRALPDADRTAAGAAAARLLDDWIAPWTPRYPLVAVERVVRCDRPVRALVEHAEGAALVVVGTRGTGEFTAMGLGSTSQAVLHHAPCPVAVVRPS